MEMLWQSIHAASLSRARRFCQQETFSLPNVERPWPAVLVIHGGSFYGGDASDAGVMQCARDLADAGYSRLRSIIG
jgi:acetyl esterase/lipase